MKPIRYEEHFVGLVDAANDAILEIKLQTQKAISLLYKLVGATRDFLLAVRYFREESCMKEKKKKK